MHGPSRQKGTSADVRYVEVIVRLHFNSHRCIGAGRFLRCVASPLSVRLVVGLVKVNCEIMHTGCARVHAAPFVKGN